MSAERRVHLNQKEYQPHGVNRVINMPQTTKPRSSPTSETGTTTERDDTWQDKASKIKAKYGKGRTMPAELTPPAQAPQPEEPYRDLTNTWKVYQLWSPMNTQAFLQQQMAAGMTLEQANDAAHAKFASQLRAANVADGIDHGEVDQRSFMATAVKNYLAQWNANSLAPKDIPGGVMTPDQQAKLEAEGKRQAAEQAQRVLREAKDNHAFLFGVPLPEHVPRKPKGPTPIEMPGEEITAGEDSSPAQAPAQPKGLKEPPKEDIIPLGPQKELVDVRREDDERASQLSRLKEGVKKWNAAKLGGEE